MARNGHYLGSDVVAIYSDGAVLDGELTIPRGARGVVLFAHGSATGRFSPTNRFIAERLRQNGFGTLLFDLLTETEAGNRRNPLDVYCLAHRLLGATEWLRRRLGERCPALGYFGADAGSAAAVIAAAIDQRVKAVVSRSGRLDLALHSVARVKAPTLLVVGREDGTLVKLNRKACERFSCQKRLAVVAGCGHFFEEPSALDEVVRLACGWFERHMLASGPRRVANLLDLGVGSLGGMPSEGLLSGAMPSSTRLGGGTVAPAAH